MMITDVEVISVKDRLPTQYDKEQGALFIFHLTGTHLDGRMGYYSPYKSWAVIGNPIERDGELCYQFEDVTEWVDYWAIIPWDKLIDNNRAQMEWEEEDEI